MNNTQTEEKNMKNETNTHLSIQSNLQEKNIDTIENLEITEGMDIVMEKWSFRKVLRAIQNQKIIVDSDFQRDEVYRTPQKSAIINSVFKGISIPGIHVFEDKDPISGKYILSVIDGQQRLSAIRDFMTNRYELRIPYGKYSVLTGYTFEQIQKLNSELIEEFEDSTLDINIIRGITKEEAQEYFGLINTTSMPLSPGEKLWSIHDPVKTILKQIVNNPYFKITNLRKTRKREYVIATKLLWNQMFKDPLKHEFVGDEIKNFIDYFNTTEDIELLEESKEKVIHLLKIYSEIVEDCQFSPRSQGDLYSVLCFLSLLEASEGIDIPLLQKFINWAFKGINKQLYPFRLREQFDKLSHNRVTSRGHTSAKEFIIMLEYLYKEEMATWNIYE